MGHLVIVIVAVINSLSWFFSAKREGIESSLLYLEVLEALLRGVGGEEASLLLQLLTIKCYNKYIPDGLLGPLSMEKHVRWKNSGCFPSCGIYVKSSPLSVF